MRVYDTSTCISAEFGGIRDLSRHLSLNFVSAVCEANRRSEVHLSQEPRLARISISIVWLFMFCHAWRAVPTFYEALHSADGLSVRTHATFGKHVGEVA